ncbi:putative quinol monooxygenase [Roseisalinus antarcticus]|uniref:putative quinol monooxygenase n=1 Tax=Roseisalinus antarcticus TaxID=254357 RepID=UPI0013565FC3|nr:putative quinol monooxygenase [Roseisalinus antarcticus]
MEQRLVAKITAVPGKEAELGQMLTRLVTDTRSEEGCLRYDLYQDPDDAGTWIFVENWASYEIWQKHVNGPGFQAFKKAIVGIAATGPYKFDDFA